MHKIILFCLPYAGATATIYKKWENLLHPSIELYPVELAGRGKRINDSFYNSINEAVEDTFRSIRYYIGKQPYAFLGYSMGSWIAFELVHRILGENMRGPEHVFFAAKEAPHLGYRYNKNLHMLDYNSFKKEVFSLGGTPKEFFEFKELEDIFMPIVRSDYKLVETYRYSDKATKLSCDITVMNGLEDTIRLEDVVQWKQHTLGGFDVFNLEDGHFFINNHSKEVFNIINNKLTMINGAGKSFLGNMA